MYLNKFCFVLVLATISASYFDEELPVYLSDDILISKLPSIAKRSVLNSPRTELEDPIEKQGEEDNKNYEMENGEESGLVFLPSFGRRSRRSISEHDEKIIKRDTSEEKHSKTSNRGINKGNGEEREIENEEESGLVFLPSFGRRTRRSAAEKDVKDLLNSESNIVFLPSFKRKGFRRFRRDADATSYRQLLKRSTETLNEPEENKKQSVFTERNEELSDSDAVNGEESGLVFLPSFGRRSRRNVADSSPTSTERNSHKYTSTTSPSTKNEDKNESHVQKIKRQVDKDHLEKKKTELNGPDKNSNDELEEESGLVFLPSFGRRSRRNVVEPSPSSTTPKIASISSVDGKHDQKHTLVSSAKKVKREVQNGNTEKKETKLDGTKEDANDESLDESGLVFLPSFGRRSRRNIEESSSSTTEQTTSTKDPQDDKKNEGKTKTGNQKTNAKNSHDETEEESGLVFLPSFGRRQRRDVSSTTSSTKKEETTTASTNVKDEVQSRKTFVVQESGLVFLPSFNRRT